MTAASPPPRRPGRRCERYGETPARSRRSESAPEGTGRVRQPCDEDVAGNEGARYPIKRVQYLSLGEMLKDIGGRYCGELPGSRIKQVTVVALLDPVQARGLGRARAICSGLTSILAAS